MLAVSQIIIHDIINYYYYFTRSCFASFAFTSEVGKRALGGRGLLLSSPDGLSGCAAHVKDALGATRPDQTRANLTSFLRRKLEKTESVRFCFWWRPGVPREALRRREFAGGGVCQSEAGTGLAEMMNAVSS